jgi:fatty acid kinase
MEALRRLRAADLAAAMAKYREALQLHREALNRLNVYPVPDGDTGTNMALTLESVMSELATIEGLEALDGRSTSRGSPPGSDRKLPATGSHAPGAERATAGHGEGAAPGQDEDAAPGHGEGAAPAQDEDAERGEGRHADRVEMSTVCKAIAHGSLMGARGNSGVILSQLLRGMTSVFAASAEPAGAEVAHALAAASEAAYKAVLRPVEGTILTVAKAAADGAKGAADTSLLAVVEAARSAADESLARTPELLPVLAEAGVVDAGGGGYLLLLDSMLTAIDGRPLPEAPPVPSPDTARAQRATGAPFEGSRSPEDWDRRQEENAGSSSGGEGDQADQRDVRFEVMYFLDAPDETIPAFKDVWEGIGDSIVVVGGDGLWNCHIHTNDVGAAIEAALDAGRPRDIRVSDLAEEVEEERWVREGARSGIGAQPPRLGPPVRTAVVAVANGEGIGRIFHSLGVHHLVPGGQSMNPSTEQILDVVEHVDSDDVVILPNNENIVPVAMQVCELAKKTVRVVPTGGIVEGFAALLEYDPEAGADENVASMGSSARRVVAGEVTRAVRDSPSHAGPITAGDWMGLSRDRVEVVGGSMSEAACGLIGKLLQDRHELVTIIEGSGALHAQTREITEWLSEQHPGVAVEVHHGGQPLYPYLLSIE